jgi:hypothetical protein
VTRWSCEGTPTLSSPSPRNLIAVSYLGFDPSVLL